ncbi:uncharacterized protein ARMOST_04484 [Armillaria ostoyae]|uniref:Uncharacterized protein n=1 Tax=Armillaria ostoyae TaxID=47428 RepID=A0A284QXF1_ARMOS|nr:uncharacterized protein ARMOST_04484 [Armillaria ostoyae]
MRYIVVWISRMKYETMTFQQLLEGVDEYACRVYSLPSRIAPSVQVGRAARTTQVVVGQVSTMNGDPGLLHA